MVMPRGRAYNDQDDNKKDDDNTWYQRTMQGLSKEFSFIRT
jgi:hypothetical protein